MNQHEKSACIGHWRNGASTMQISVVMNISFWIVERTIENYGNEIVNHLTPLS